MTFGVVSLLNVVVLLSWTLVAPLEWTRSFQDSTDIFDRYVASYASCTNDGALPFIIVIIVMDIILLALGNFWCYQCRNIETEYHENRYIGISMASVLQAWCMGIPILIVVWDNPPAKFFVETGIVFITALAVLLLIYVPKILAIRAERIQRIQDEKRNAFLRYSDRSRRNQFDDDDKGGSSEQITSGASKPPPQVPPSNGNMDQTSDGTTKPTAENNGEDEAAAVTGIAVTGGAVAGVATANPSGSPPDRRSLPL